MSVASKARTLALQAVRFEGRMLGLRGTRRLAMALYNPYDREQDYLALTVPYHDGLIQIDTRSFIEWWICVYGGFETGAIQLLRRLLHPGSVVIDVGANIGAFTLPLAHAVNAGGRSTHLSHTPESAAVCWKTWR
jgi:hypothetical protein